MDETQTPDSMIEVRWPRCRTSQFILRGEHDLSTAAPVESVLTETLRRSTRMVVDLRETHFIDTSTIRVLLTAKRLADQGGKSFTLVLGSSSIVLGGSSIVERVLELTEAIATLNLTPNLDEALATDTPPLALGVVADGGRIRRAALRDVSAPGAVETHSLRAPP